VALVKCKECGDKVSAIAKACPYCGAEYDFAAHASAKPAEPAHITIEIKFQCPHCDAQELLADTSLSGQALECPVCGKSVMVPEYQKEPPKLEPTKLAIIPVAELREVRHSPSFQCPHCDKELLADSSLSGLATECPVCAKSVMVPEYQPTKAIIPVAELVKVKTDSDEGFKCHICNQAIAKGERRNQCFPATSGPYKSLTEHFSNEGELGWKPDLKGGYRLTPRRETGQGSTEHRDDEPSNGAAVQSVDKAASFMRGLAIFGMIGVGGYIQSVRDATIGFADGGFAAFEPTGYGWSHWLTCPSADSPASAGVTSIRWLPAWGNSLPTEGRRFIRRYANSSSDNLCGAVCRAFSTRCTKDYCAACQGSRSA
jgi:transcription elongation factor Elf1